MKQFFAIAALSLMTSVSANAFDAKVACQSIYRSQPVQLKVSFKNASYLTVAYTLVGEGTAYSRGYFDAAKSTKFGEGYSIYDLTDFNPGTTLLVSPGLFSNGHDRVVLTMVTQGERGAQEEAFPLNCQVVSMHVSQND